MALEVAVDNAIINRTAKMETRERGLPPWRLLWGLSGISQVNKGMFMGIDVGTTSIKAGLFDTAGRQLEYYNSLYPTQRNSEGWVEQDADVWVDHIWRAISAFTVSRDLSSLSAVGITSQANTHVFVDAAGNALTPAIVWQDGRCGPEAAELDAQIADKDRIDWWGAPMPVDASHCLSRMKWMADRRPDVWDKTRWVMLPKDYCILKLTGEAVSDPISNIGLIDRKLNYIPKLLDLVPGAAAKLPPLAAMTEIVGTVKAGEQCGGTPVAASTMDAWASMYGVGVKHSGQAFYLSGTSEVLGVISDAVVPTPGILVFPKIGDVTVHAGPTQSGGASVLWYCNMFKTTPEEMARLVEGLDFDDPCPIFLPHLQGERAPLWDINARGTILGMDARTGKGEFARAVYEGVGFSARLLAETLRKSAADPIESFNCGGGGFQSDVWNQIRADILGACLRRTCIKDPGVLGSAGMAAVAGGVFPDLESALAEFVKFDRIYEPDARRAARYDEGFQLYQDTYRATCHINHQLAIS
ncbi:MAG: xylulokinase [Alphaproteobacteria bacterium]